MKKLLVVAALAMLSIVPMTGCTTVDRGRVAGVVLYEAYNKIKEKHGEEVAGKIEKVWLVLDSVETFEELPKAWETITADVDDLIAKIDDDYIRKHLEKLRTKINKKIEEAIAYGVSSKKAQEFLVALRDEIRECIKQTNAS